MFRSPSASPRYEPSSGSSARSSRSPTGKHSPPPLWSATSKLIPRIKDFLDNDFYDFDSNDLILPVKPTEFTAFLRELRHPRYLDQTRVPKIRYTWNRETSTLTISCMTGPVHDALIAFLGYFKEEMTSIHPTTLSERRAITYTPGKSVPLLCNPDESVITGRGKHIEGLYKVPDAAFGFIDRRPNAPSTTAGCPRVLFEVAFSQSYESVLEDARQWLVRSEGKVVLCIIIKITEMPKHQPEHEVHEHNNSAEASRTASLGSLTADTRMASMDGRNQFLNSASEHSQWVGPLTGFLELYRLAPDSTCIIRDGPRYDVFDPASPDPVILMSDLLPNDAIEGAVDRAYPLVLADYRMFLAEGVQELALVRKLKAEKKVLQVEGRDSTGDQRYADDGEGSSDDGAVGRGEN